MVQRLDFSPESTCKPQVGLSFLTSVLGVSRGAGLLFSGYPVVMLSVYVSTEVRFGQNCTRWLILHTSGAPAYTIRSPGSLLNTFQISDSVSVSVAMEQVTADTWSVPSGSDRSGGGKTRLAHWVFPLLEARSRVLLVCMSVRNLRGESASQHAQTFLSEAGLPCHLTPPVSEPASESIP